MIVDYTDDVIVMDKLIVVTRIHMKLLKLVVHYSLFS